MDEIRLTSADNTSVEEHSAWALTDTYPILLRCANCGEDFRDKIYRVPKGTLSRDFASREVCPRCGCREVESGTPPGSLPKGVSASNVDAKRLKDAAPTLWMPPMADNPATQGEAAVEDLYSLMAERFGTYPARLECVNCNWESPEPVAVPKGVPARNFAVAKGGACKNCGCQPLDGHGLLTWGERHG